MHDSKNVRGHVVPASYEAGVSIEGTVGREHGFSAKEVLWILRRRLWIIVALVVLLVGMALGWSFIQTPIYEASTKMVVGQELGPNQPGNVGADVQGLSQFTRTAVQVVRTSPVAEEVVQRLNLSMTPEELLRGLSAEQVTETQVIEVNYLDSDPKRAKQVADTVGEVFSRQISELSPSTNAITATLWERATLPEAPVSPKPLRNMLVALVLGVILGVGLALLLEYLDDSWSSPEEAEQISGLHTFAVIPEFEMPTGKKEG